MAGIVLGIALGVVSLAGALVVYLSIGALAQGYSWSEMDWNGDGCTSPAEFLHAGDVGRRPAPEAGPECSEFFEYKDGRTTRVACPAVGADQAQPEP